MLREYMLSAILYCDACGAANRAMARFCYACGEPLHTGIATTSSGVAEGDGVGPLAAHDVLKQRYHILQQMGQGGFGAVYKAEDREFCTLK